MTMAKESEKYDKVINLLRKSKPVLDSTEDIEREVINRLSRAKPSGLSLADVIDFLFGWVNIKWIRWSLITASIVLVLFFVYQQSVILKQIEILSNHTTIIEEEPLSRSSYEIGKMVMMYKLSGRKIPAQCITISEKQMEQLLESVNELQVKYRDLLNLIKEDPELKKYIEEKLNENNRIKIKL